MEQFYFSKRLDLWLDSKAKEVTRGNIAPSTLKTYKTYSRKFYMPFFGAKDIREIRTYDIQTFYESLPELSNKYTKSLIETLKNFLTEMRRLDYIAVTPSYPRIKVAEKPIKWIDRDTQDAVISHIESRHQPIYTFMTRQICRPSEARALKVRDISLKEGSITIQRTFSGHELIERNKEKKITARALNPELTNILTECVKNKLPDAFVFSVNGAPYTRNAINRIWNNACKKIGIVISLYNGTKHSICSQAGIAGISDSNIQQLANHADIRSTKKYICKDNLDSQKAVYLKLATVTRLSPESKQASKNP